jgi:hypothetical protein
MILAALIAAPAAAAGGGGGTPAPGGTIYFRQITVPMDTLAVAPNGTGLRGTGCLGDRTMTLPRRVLRVEPTGTTFPVMRAPSGTVQVDEVRLVATDDACGSRTILLDLPPRTTATTASWSLDAHRVAAFVRRYDADGRLQDQGIWVGETAGSCGDTVCAFHLASPIAVELRTDGLPFEQGTGYLSWSSDGRRVVYGRAPDYAHAADPAIFVADLGAPYTDGTQADRQVVVPGGTPYQPAFSPIAGDDRIAFVQRVGTRSCARNDIFITTPSGGTAQRLSPTTVGVCQLLDPAWSPDGQWFTYSGWSGALSDQQAIYRVKADGSGKPVLVAGSKTAVYRGPVWRP